MVIWQCIYQTTFSYLCSSLGSQLANLQHRWGYQVVRWIHIYNSHQLQVSNFFWCISNIKYWALELVRVLSDKKKIARWTCILYREGGITCSQHIHATQTWTLSEEAWLTVRLTNIFCHIISTFLYWGSEEQEQVICVCTIP